MTGTWHGGKGSVARPISDKKQFEDNWDRIFGNKDKEREESEEDTYYETTGHFHMGDDDER